MNLIVNVDQNWAIGHKGKLLVSIPEDMKFYTIHDAICVRESEGTKVKEVMEQVSMDMYGVKIAVKIENASADQVR